MKIGYHTDWAGGFPFAEMGLANNYDLPLASLTDLGSSTMKLFWRLSAARSGAGLRIPKSRWQRKHGKTDVISKVIGAICEAVIAGSTNLSN